MNSAHEPITTKTRLAVDTISMMQGSDEQFNYHPRDASAAQARGYAVDMASGNDDVMQQMMSCVHVWTSLPR